MDFLDNTDQKHRPAGYYKRKAVDSNKEQLDKVFKLIDAAAESGEYVVELPINIQIKEDQEEYLQNLGFEIEWQWDHDDDSLKRWSIDFENANEE